MSKYEKVDINPADDHMEKWNREPDELQKANEKLKIISALPELVESKEIEEATKYIMKDYAGGKIKVIPKTKNEYEEIWNAFLEVEPEYKKFMGYGKKTISKIGYKDFIDYMGWNSIADIERWKNNILHVVPCVHCKQHFTNAEQDFGLCPKCKEEYEWDRFIQMVSANEQDKPGSINAIRIMFMYDAAFRNRYKKKTDSERYDDCLAENFEGFDTYRYIKDNLVKEEGDANLVLERMLAPLRGRKDYGIHRAKLETIFIDLLELDNVEEQVKILQDIFLKEDEEAEN